MARRWRRAGYGHTNFALVVAAWKRKKKQRRNRPYLSGIGRRRRSSASRGGGTTWSSKCGRCSPKGGTTTGRGTPREARGNAHHPTNRVRRRRTHDEAEQRHPPSYRYRRGDRVLRQQDYGPRHRLVL